MRIMLLGVLLFAGVASAADGGGFDVVGVWNWSLVGGDCRERYTYRADGTLSAESGEERLEKTYTLTGLEGGMYRLDATVTATNGKTDCEGGLTPVGATSRIYLMPLKGGGYFTCASEDTLSCYGNAYPVRTP